MYKNKFYEIVLIVFLFLNHDLLIAGGGELWILNESSQQVRVHVYPISMVFNYDRWSPTGPNYNLVAWSRDVSQGQYFISAATTYHFFNEIQPLDHIEYDFDHVGGPASGTVGSIGFGKYKVDFYWDPNKVVNEDPPDDYFTLEIDWGYTYRPDCGGGQCGDLFIEFRNGIPRLWYHWWRCGILVPYKELPPNRELLEREKCTDPLTYWPKDLGNFRYNNGSSLPQGVPNLYDIIPQDARVDCIPQYFPYFQGDANNEFYDNRVGYLTLNLIIEKNIKTRTLEWPPDPENPPPIVITDGATLKLTHGTNNAARTLTFKKYLGFDFSTPLYIQSGGLLWLEDANPQNSNEKAQIIFENLGYSQIAANARIKLGAYSDITLNNNSIMKLFPNSKVENAGNSTIHINNGSVLYDCGTITPRPGRLPNIIITGGNPPGRYIFSSTACNESERLTGTFDLGAYLFVDGGTVEIGDSCKFVFDGPDSYMQIEPGSTILLGEGALIELKNGAYIDADGCTFTYLNAGDIWNGIKLDGAGSQSVIKNCTFNNAVTAVDITSTQCEITDNQINVPENVTGAAGISLTNVTNVLLQHNTLNLGYNPSASGINFFNYDGEGAPGGGGGSSYSLIVIGNIINGGAYPINISCLTSSQLPFYVCGNQFNPVSGISSYGLFAYNITGNIKLNSFNNTYNNQAVTLQQSMVNMFDNSLQSNLTTLTLQSGSSTRMAPIQNLQGQWAWTGGNNGINSNLSNCVSFSSGSNPVISPKGNNCFAVSSQANYFITGEYCLGANYNAYENNWEPDVTSQSFDIYCESTPVPAIYTPYYSECPMTIGEIVGYEVTDMGFGIYDTVFITSSGGGGGGSNEGSIKAKVFINPGNIYYEALSKRKNGDFAGAISKCKEIIDNHDTSKHFIPALSELYLNHLESDTIRNQNITSGLFNSLKSYLNQKMQQYHNKPVFVQRAYKHFLMCLVKARSFTEAMAGYENIMNNHPDPVVKLNASWDRSAVVLLMGQGGGMDSRTRGNDNTGTKKLLDKNPAHRIASQSFEKEKAKSERISSENSERASNVKYSKDEKARIHARVEKFNPSNKAELRNKINSDVKLLNEINVRKSEKVRNLTKPIRFSLQQNYPNPFNPITEIKYELPKSTFVSIKIYNALGELVKTLVNNEYKTEGTYTAKFDGTNFASGIYFYSLETKDFRATRKMVLIK